ncbi:hypothetical protein H0W80_01855 [Candidatus Saccharibacteria bacterium]|nr:hypothetical protein [Candidatus Saccharibacteria bacterium]
MNHLPQITFNLILFALLGGLSALGFLFGENRLKSISYGAFMSFFIVFVSSETAMNDLATKINFPIITAKLGFIALVCTALFLGALIDQKKARNKIRSIPLAFITGLFICGYGVGLLPAKAQQSLVTDFNLAAQIYNFRMFFMVALAIWLVVIQFIPAKKDDDEKKK